MRYSGARDHQWTVLGRLNTGPIEERACPTTQPWLWVQIKTFHRQHLGLRPQACWLDMLGSCCRPLGGSALWSPCHRFEADSKSPLGGRGFQHSSFIKILWSRISLIAKVLSYHDWLLLINNHRWNILTVPLITRQGMHHKEWTFA